MLIQNIPFLEKSNTLDTYPIRRAVTAIFEMESPRIPNMTLKRDYVYGYNGSCRGILVVKDPIRSGEEFVDMMDVKC